MLNFGSYLQMLQEAEPIPAVPAQPVGRRRKYGRRFSADKTMYLDFKKKDGKPYWRKKSAQNIVFYGKQQDHDTHDK